MMIKNIYQDKILKYPLSDDELKLIDKVWEFSELFNFRTLYVSSYRKKIIKKITKKYTPSEFLIYENILDKLFWNLRWIIFPLWIFDGAISEKNYDAFIKNNYGQYKEIPNSLLLCEKTYYDNNNQLEKIINKFLTGTYLRSFINKIIIIDTKNKLIYLKPIECSSNIFSKNYFNLYTSTISSSRKLYEKTMTYPYKEGTHPVQLPDFYYESDYAFPNINYCVYNIDNNETRLEKIKKMYFDTGAVKNWYKLFYKT